MLEAVSCFHSSHTIFFKLPSSHLICFASSVTGTVIVSLLVYTVSNLVRVKIVSIDQSMKI